jgi:hypothetical protein
MIMIKMIMLMMIIISTARITTLNFSFYID